MGFLENLLVASPSGVDAVRDPNPRSLKRQRSLRNLRDPRRRDLARLPRKAVNLPRRAAAVADAGVAVNCGEGARGAAGGSCLGCSCGNRGAGGCGCCSSSCCCGCGGGGGGGCGGGV